MCSSDLRRATVVEQELRHALEDIESIRGHAEAQLHIGFTAVASSGALPDAMATYRQNYPNVTLRAGTNTWLRLNVRDSMNIDDTW